MLNLLNQTPFTAQVFLSSNYNNQSCGTCVVKMGFKFDSRGILQLLPEHPFIQLSDEYVELEKGKLKLKALSDIIPYKPYAEVIIWFDSCTRVQSSEYFKLGEFLTLKGLYEYNHETVIYLPKYRFSLFYQDGWEEKLLSLVCDTVIIYTETKEIYLLLRALIPWDVDSRKRGYLILKEEEGIIK